MEKSNSRRSMDGGESVLSPAGKYVEEIPFSLVGGGLAVTVLIFKLTAKLFAAAAADVAPRL